jgi:hypothetical protein
VWQAVGDEIIIFIDVNKNVYTGPLAKALRRDGLQMEEQTLCSTGKETPRLFVQLGKRHHTVTVLGRWE